MFPHNSNRALSLLGFFHNTPKKKRKENIKSAVSKSNLQAELFCYMIYGIFSSLNFLLLFTPKKERKKEKTYKAPCQTQIYIYIFVFVYIYTYMYT